jgi:uncharacterized membrane protein YkvA (DUF1232 family)
MTEKILLLYSAMRDKRTPWYAKALLIFILAYIVSPIDIIPDFIPVLGLLDEVILVPIALAIVFKLIPESIERDVSLKQIDNASKQKLMVMGIILTGFVWILIIALVVSFNPF